MKLTLAEAAMGAGAVLEAPASIAQAGTLVASGYSIDSRTVAPGELFFAVRGERLDGHDFVAAALERGAVAAVVSRARVATLPDAALAVPLLIAEDPLIALQSLAAHVRRQWGKRVVAITGSAGKTTTKEAIAAPLGAKFNVLKSQGNLNNAFGLPLQLLRLEPEHEYAVVEMGMNHLGEIAALARIASPDWGVVTNVGTAHIENFTEGQAGIARAKFELVAALPANGVAFLNCYDPYVSQFGRDFRGTCRLLRRRPVRRSADMRVRRRISRAARSLSRRRARGQFTLNLLGAHNASNAMAGLAVALEAGVDLDAAVAALDRSQPGNKRGEVLEIAGATILNDSYNSNPEALRSMIHTLAARPAQRRILVAGEMLELGEHGPTLHAACGKAAAEAGLDLVVGVRGNAQHLAAAACWGGVASIFLPDAADRRRLARQESCSQATWCWSKVRAACSLNALSKSSRINAPSGKREIEIVLAILPSALHCMLLFLAARSAIQCAPDHPTWTKAFPSVSHRGQSLLRGQRRSRRLSHRHAPGQHSHQQQPRILAAADQEEHRVAWLQIQRHQDPAHQPWPLRSLRGQRRNQASHRREILK